MSLRKQIFLLATISVFVDHWGRGSEMERPFLKEVTSTQMWASWIGRETSDVYIVAKPLLHAVAVVMRCMAYIFIMCVGRLGIHGIYRYQILRKY